METRTSTCPECGVESDADQAFCSGCGLRLPTAAGGGPGRTRRRAEGRPVDQLERSRARSEFGRIKQVVLMLRTFFWVAAAGTAVQALLWPYLIARLVEALEVTEEYGWLPTALSILLWGETALMLAGALLVLRAPLVFSIVAACTHTLNTALIVYDGRQPLVITVYVVLLLAFWAAVAQAARIQRLMAAHPDLQFVRKRIDASRRVTGGIAEQARERRQAERRAARLARLRLAGIVAGSLVLAGVAIWWINRPPAPATAVASFVDGWHRGDLAAIDAMFADGATSRGASDLHEELQRRGWDRRPPRLADASIEDRGGGIVARFGRDAEQMTLAMRLDGSRWVIHTVQLPDFEVDGLDAVIDRFRTAWAAAGTGALVAMFREIKRDRNGPLLERILAKHGWADERPAIEDMAMLSARDGRARVGFAVDGKELTVQFEYRHPQWNVETLSLR